MTRARKALLLTVAMTLAAGCEREMRRFVKTPGPGVPAAAPAPRNENQPGMPGRGLAEKVSSPTYDERNAYEIAQGKKLFRWFNCIGCHAAGGGGMGPALMDEAWIYGYEPEQIFSTIMDGRPNGMPAFRGRIPETQVWQLTAYVRSMSKLVPADAAPGRADALAAVQPELRRERAEPHLRKPP